MFMGEAVEKKVLSELLEETELNADVLENCLLYTSDVYKRQQSGDNNTI